MDIGRRVRAYRNIKDERGEVMEEEDVKTLVNKLANIVRQFPNTLEIEIERAYYLGYNQAIKDSIKIIKGTKVKVE